MTYGNYKKGSRCPTCRNIKSSKTQRASYEDIREYIQKYGYFLISEKSQYKNAHTKLKVRCNRNHEYFVSYSKFKCGGRCPYCNLENKRLEFDDVKKQIEDIGFTLLSEKYKNAHEKLKIKCPKDHIFYMSFRDLKKFGNCPVCTKISKISSLEREIKKFVSYIYDGIIKPNDRNTIVNPITGYNLELDVYLPEINKAIEFNGDYWHSFDLSKKHDEIKKKECEKLDIDLLVVKEYDWKNNKESCLNDIRRFVI